MYGTFNDLELRKMRSLKITSEPSGFAPESWRGLEQFRLKAVLLILSSQTIEGRILQYSADLYHGYEVTIESKTSEDPKTSD